MTTLDPKTNAVSLPQAPQATNFRLPGPTPVPPQVAAAGAWPMMNHRSPEFTQILRRVTGNLQHFFQTEQPVLCFPGSGSAGWEVSIANFFSPADTVAVISIGNFGDRYALAAQSFGLNVTKIDFPWGQAADPAVVAEKISQIANLRGVFFTHNETSTSVANDVAALSKAIAAAVPDALISVDAVSSLGCVSVPMDELGIDMLFTGSQKGWMTPPGLMMFAATKRALEASKSAKLPRFYWDVNRALDAMSHGYPPYTIPVSLWYQLDVALTMMRAEGREHVFARHAEMGAYVRRRAQELGLKLFADQRFASNTVTAIYGPEGKDVKTFLKTLKEQDNVVFAGGQAKLDGVIFRAGHMGYATIDDLAEAFNAVERRMGE